MKPCRPLYGLCKALKRLYKPFVRPEKAFGMLWREFLGGLGEDFGGVARSLEMMFVRLSGKN